MPSVQDSLFEVSIPTMSLNPVFWAHTGKRVPVIRATWFINDDTHPCEWELAEELEKGYQYVMSHPQPAFVECGSTERSNHGFRLTRTSFTRRLNRAKRLPKSLIIRYPPSSMLQHRSSTRMQNAVSSCSTYRYHPLSHTTLTLLQNGHDVLSEQALLDLPAIQTRRYDGLSRVRCSVPCQWQKQ